MSTNYRIQLLFVPILLGFAFSNFIYAAEASAPSGPAVTTSAAVAPATAKSTGKSCDELKSQIDAKLKAKGVKTFSLEIVGKEDVKDAKVVGSCEGGSKKITYKRG